MNIRLQTQQISGLSLLITIIGSLPFYVLVTLMFFLDFTVFISFLGALALSSLLDRFVSYIIQGRPQSQVDLVQRQILRFAASILPFLSKTPINPVIRRITMLVGLLSYFFFSPLITGIAVTILLAALYVEYVELLKPLTTIVWGFLVGGISSGVFILLQLL